MLRAYWNDLHTRQASVLAMIKQAPLGAYGAKKRRSFGTSPTEKMKGLRQMTIGRNIRSLRERYGLTQCELAERAGVTQVYISYCENGRKEPSLKFCRKLAAVFGCPVSDIVDSDERGAG